jgi:RNA polymerase sigma factor (sigma-70 family)
MCRGAWGTMGGPGSFIQQIEALFDAGVLGEQTDRQLLERFTGRDRAAAELAFTVLVKRHGTMVYRACRAILRDPHEAEDAFQATFLILARKAQGLWVLDSLGPWLLSVARRTASCDRAAASRRRARERMVALSATSAADDPGWDDRDAIVYEELGRLPEKYRTAVLLCDLEGLTQDEAARHLGWPDGTVRSRLARGRERLRKRLTRRGIAPTVILAGTGPAIDATTLSMVEMTVQAALRLASGEPAPGVATSVIALMKGALRIMFWSKVKTTAAVAMTGALLCGTGVLGYRAMGRQQVSPSGQSGTKRERSDVTRSAAPPSDPESAELVALGKARIELAERIRNSVFTLFKEGEATVGDYLAAQKRYDEVVAEVMITTDADRVRFLERQVAGLKQVEDHVRQLFDRGQVQRFDADRAKLARLDAEYALAKAKAKVISNAK